MAFYSVSSQSRKKQPTRFKTHSSVFIPLRVTDVVCHTAENASRCWCVSADLQETILSCRVSELQPGNSVSSERLCEPQRGRHLYRTQQLTSTLYRREEALLQPQRCHVNTLHSVGRSGRQELHLELESACFHSNSDRLL